MRRLLSYRIILFLLLLSMPAVSVAQSTETQTGATGATEGAQTTTATDVGSLTVNTPFNNGVYNCNKIGAQTVGATSAVGGTFVPVSDAAVTLNTGYLVYKECLLRPLIDAQKKFLTLQYVDQNLQLFSKGRNGEPLWVKHYGKELASASDDAYYKTFRGPLLSTMNPVFEDDVKRALVRNYLMTTQSPQNSLTCPYQGDLRAVLDGKTTDIWGGLGAMINPACQPYGTYVLADSQMAASVAVAQNEWVTRLNWNNGIYDVRDADGNVTTPGIFLNAIGAQSITSGFRQLENANDIGQMVGNVFAGLGSQLLSSSAGIPGSKTYLADAIQQEYGGLLGQTTAIALQNLYQLLSWEQQFNSIIGQEATVLTNSINALRASENECWALIVPKVCASAPSNGMCTATSGATLKIATSTAFSDAAIAQAGIAAAANGLKTAIDGSNQNIVVFNSLIIAVQSTDAAARNTALQNLDTFVNLNPPRLHTQESISQAQQDLATMQAKLLGDQGSIGYIKQTRQNWAGDGVDQYGSAVKGAVAWNGTLPPTGSDIGWCNINQQKTLDLWIQKWTQ